MQMVKKSGGLKVNAIVLMDLLLGFYHPTWAMQYV